MLSTHVDPATYGSLSPFPPIQRLSLHGCQTLPASVYPLLLSHLPELTHLVRSIYDVSDRARILAQPKSTLLVYFL
jgi:hypothetical protein